MLKKAVLNFLYFSQLDRLSSPVTGGIGNIWMLHRVTNLRQPEFAPNRHLRISPEFLDASILHCKQQGFRFVSLDTLVETLRSAGNTKPDDRLISITLDDGYKDTMENALPIFRRHAVPYTVFVASGFVDGTHSIWWEDLEAIIAKHRKITVPFPDGAKTFDTALLEEKKAVYARVLKSLTEQVSEDEQREIVLRLSKHHKHDLFDHARRELMTWEQLAEINSDPLCTLGPHTVGHFAIARLDEDRARDEILQSQARLKEKTGSDGLHFAYPYGYARAAASRDYDLVKSLGFRSAVTTRYGVIEARGRQNIHAIPRISINGYFQSQRYLRPLLSGFPAAFKRFDKQQKFA